MKKLILLGMILLLPSCLFSGTQERIKELETEGKQLQQQAQQYQQALSQIQIRLVQIGAIIGELKGDNQKPKEVPKDGRARGEDPQD